MNLPAYKVIPLGRLKPYSRNARTHSAEQIEQIARSIREFGFTNPLLVTSGDDVVAGHGRLEAARAVGMEEVPCIVLDGLTDAQRRALVLADNKLALNAGWDVDLLRAELRELRIDGFDLGLTGFSVDELSDLFVELDSGLTDPDAAPGLEDRSVTVHGDVWIMGRHRLLCGDATLATDVDRVLAGVEPHLMVTDPPYGVRYDPMWRKEAGLVGDNLASGRVSNDERADWREAWALFPGTVAYVWHGGLHAGVVAESLRACRFGVRAQIVWVKTRHVISRGHYHWQHEPCFYGVRDGSDDQWRFVPEHEVAAYAVKEGKPAGWRGDRKQSTVWFIENLKNETGHSTQKPVQCMLRPIENNSSPGQVVYEPFCGSGTTVIAAQMSGRACYAVELEPRYCDVTVKRWQEFTGKKAVHEDSGRTFDELKEARDAQAGPQSDA